MKSAGTAPSKVKATRRSPRGERGLKFEYMTKKYDLLSVALLAESVD